jgi:hypothetical protein
MPTMIQLDHDHYGSDSNDRISKDDWRNPRAVTISVNAEGQEFWGEISKGECGEVMDTTLTGRVLDPIEREVRLGRNAGSVMVDGIEYVFVVDRQGG